MTLAIAFLPDGPLDPVFVNQCIAHCNHRGYTFVGLVRDWSSALAMIHARTASVIVFARDEHLDPQREPRVEVCGDDTQALFRQAPGPAPATHHRGRPRIVS